MYRAVQYHAEHCSTLFFNALILLLALCCPTWQAPAHKYRNSLTVVLIEVAILACISLRSAGISRTTSHESLWIQSLFGRLFFCFEKFLFLIDQKMNIWWGIVKSCLKIYKGKTAGRCKYERENVQTLFKNVKKPTETRPEYEHVKGNCTKVV